VKASTRNQRGAALLALAAMLAAGTLAVLVPYMLESPSASTRQQATSAALAHARDALIGWSAARDDEPGHNYRPGELPCPDRSAPGEADYGYAEGSCSPGEIGRLPWKTLGLPELVDGDGEPLWYAVDGAFRWRWGTAVATNMAINSDTRATLLVFAADAVAAHTPAGGEGAAVVFAAGAPLSGQARGTAAERTDARNYLDRIGPPAVASTIDNSQEGGPFFAGPVRDAAGNLIANDRAAVVTARDLMNAVAPRVEGVVVRVLKAYRVFSGRFPNPSRFDSLQCTDVTVDPSSAMPITVCGRDPVACRGRLPEDIWTPYMPPRWFRYNLWSQTIYYAVGEVAVENPAGCIPQLQVTGALTADALILLPGSPLGAVVRNSPSQSTDLSRYLEDAQNQDGWTGFPAPDTYAAPGAGSNDRLRTL
jgi:hypothetical protein